VARKIVVFGSLNRDVVLRVPHLPIEGETVLGGAIDDYFGGKGSNQAVAAARLGAEVALIGRVGNDATGKEMIDTLARENIDVTGIEIDRETPTGVALIMVDAEGRNIIAVSPGANGVVGELEVERLRTALEEDDVLVVQLEIPALAAKSALKTAFRIGARVILNATPVDDSTFELLDGVDFVVVNAREAATLFKRRVESASTAGKVAADVQRYGRAGTVIVTLGAAGAVLRSSDTAIDVPGFKVESVDSVGAGDAFVGGLAASLLRGDSIEDVIRFGCAAGAVATTRYGAQPSLPALQELDGLLNGGGRTTGLELV
jgi:ribokinase